MVNLVNTDCVTRERNEGRVSKLKWGRDKKILLLWYNGVILI